MSHGRPGPASLLYVPPPHHHQVPSTIAGQVTSDLSRGETFNIHIGQLEEGREKEQGLDNYNS